MILYALIGFVASAAVIAAAAPISEFLMNGRSPSILIVCAAPALFFCAVLSVERGYYEGLHNMYPTAVSEIIETAFKLILGLGAAYAVRHYALSSFADTGACFGMKCENFEQAQQTVLPYVAAAAILGTSAASAIACLYTLLYSRIRGDGVTREMLKKDRTVDKTADVVKRLLRLSIPIALTALITTLAGMIDMLTIEPCISKAMEKAPGQFESLLTGGINAKMLPNFVYGSYEGLAAAVAGLIPTLTAMLGKSILPSVAEGFAKGDTAEVGRNVNKMLILSGMIAFPSGIGVSLFSEDILQLLFFGRTQEIAVASQSLRIMGASVVVMSLSLPCFTLLLALGRSRTAAVIMISGGIIKLIVNLLLISTPEYSLIGAAISDVISEGFICAASMTAIFRLSKTRPDVRNIFIKPCYSGAMAVTAGFLVKGILTKQPFIPLGSRIVTVLSIVFSVIMYLIIALVLCEMPKNIDIPLFCKKNRKKT